MKVIIIYNMESTTLKHIINSLSQDNNIRKEAEQYFIQKKNDNIELLLTDLFSIATLVDNTQYREMAFLLIKNIIDLEDNWFKLSFSNQNSIRKSLYENIHNTTYPALIFAKISMKEYKKNNPTQILYFIRNIFNEGTNTINPDFLLVIRYFMEDLREGQNLSTDIVNPLLGSIYKVINEFLKNSSINTEAVIINFLSIYTCLLPYLSKTFLNNEHKIFPLIIQMIKPLTSLNIVKQCILTISETISLYESSMVKYIHDIHTLLYNILNSTKYNDIIELCLNIYCLFCDLEMKHRTEITNFLVENSKEISTLLLDILSTHCSIALIETSEWTTSQACAYILSFLIQSDDCSLLQLLLIFISSNFNSDNEISRYTSLIILSCCLETRHKNTLCNILLPDMKNIIEKIKDNNPIVSYTVSWVLGKISEMVPILFDRTSFIDIIPFFIEIISQSSIEYSIETRINISIVFGNLIKYYGDEKTTERINPFNSYYKQFINRFLDDCVKEENIKNNLSFYLIRIIMNAVQYSSLDFQDHLEILLNAILDKYTMIINNTGGRPYNNLEENLCLIINQIFNKIIRNVNITLCKRVYHAITQSFKKRNSPYETGMLCLFNIVILLHNKEHCFDTSEDTLNHINTSNCYYDGISINLDEFFLYLTQSINIKTNPDNDILIQSAILTINNLSWIKSLYLQEYSKQIIEYLFAILISPDIKHTTKLLAISSIGDMCLNIPFVLEENIDKIVPLLFSAFDIILGSKDDMSNENLLITILQTFSMILLSLQEKNKERIIFFYIKQLINYITCFAERNYSSSAKDKLILLFGDILNLLGERIREFCSKDEVYLISKKLEDNSEEDFYKWMIDSVNKIFTETTL